MLKKKGFSLVEVIVVIIIIGILAALALPGFGVTKERTLDKEAKASLRLIQAAQKIYRMEMGFYFPRDSENPTGRSSSDVSEINTNLRVRLRLPPTPPQTLSWNYMVDSVTQQIRATRNKTGGRYFTIPFGSDTITCTPNSDTCP
ncbi:MAG: prepilin-type N-terminal cleavage/methylation domain-containing protein [Candidatus Omnitrophica bacterium]|nr:prepilin-type N-terminal cleavage/methylation domain-containing protein [Candidatus Omnitrophota bacterium]